MKPQLHRLEKKRWFDPGEYHDSWAQRNSTLLNLLESVGIKIDELSFSEYGCGPNKPFEVELRKRYQSKVISLDMNIWDQRTIAIDLDMPDMPQTPHSDIGVLSGVVEYLKSPLMTFSKLRQKHQYLLFSYRIFQFDPAGPVENYSKVLSDRAKKGWKNHLSIEEILKSTESFGYILATGTWQKQSLFLLNRW